MEPGAWTWSCLIYFRGIYHATSNLRIHHFFTYLIIQIIITYLIKNLLIYVTFVSSKLVEESKKILELEHVQVRVRILCANVDNFFN